MSSIFIYLHLSSFIFLFSAAKVQQQKGTDNHPFLFGKEILRRRQSRSIRLDGLSEVIAEAYPEANLREVLEVVQAHVHINCGLDADMVVEIEAIADLGCDVEVVGLCIRTYMLVLEAAAEEQSILLHVITSGNTQVDAVVTWQVFPTELTEHHPTVGNEETAYSLQPKTEVFGLAVAEA